MKNLLLPEDSGEAFLTSAVEHGYGMEQQLFQPTIGGIISNELERAGLLHEMIELIPTEKIYEEHLTMTGLLHTALNNAVNRVSGYKENHLPWLSVRVFDPSEPSTTIHRNHHSIGPWAIGNILKGEAPFNVYAHEDLPEGHIIPLDDPNAPDSEDTLYTQAGSAWALYTAHEQKPHSGGVVESNDDRELLLFYGMQY